MNMHGVNALLVTYVAIYIPWAHDGTTVLDVCCYMWELYKYIEGIRYESFNYAKFFNLRCII